MSMTPTEAVAIVKQAITDGEIHTTKPVNRALLVLLDLADPVEPIVWPSVNRDGDAGGW